ncbi:unnamed protein product [Miscanthus lutarioriparius]|uniref:Auxin-responsive protein n=1 Tax=Miscanthus lutarioriparius TaxID=422564 RepID=A0A811N0L6_9POAL|nr:unnamed protein product [Miscanthus lutarioriparius]
MEDVRLWDCRCGGRRGRHEGPRYGDGDDRARRAGGLHPYACRYLLLGAPMMADGACADARVPGVVNDASNHQEVAFPNVEMACRGYVVVAKLGALPPTVPTRRLASASPRAGIRFARPVLIGPQARKCDRSVDLIKFNGYTDLIAELDEMFDFKGGGVPPPPAAAPVASAALRCVAAAAAPVRSDPPRLATVLSASAGHTYSTPSSTVVAPPPTALPPTRARRSGLDPRVSAEEPQAPRRRFYFASSVRGEPPDGVASSRPSTSYATGCAFSLVIVAT